MEQDLVYQEDTIEGTNISNNVHIENEESFSVKADTSRDDIDAQFEALFSDSEESTDGDAVEQIQKLPIHIQKIEEVELQKPVFSKTFKPKTVMMFAKMEKPENPMQNQDDGEVHSFFSKPFSPDAVQKWNEGIRRKQSFKVNCVEEHYGSRQL
jgi:Mg2+/Co2+ transporter CorC